MTRTFRTALLPLFLLAAACEDPPKHGDPKDQADGMYVVATAHYLQGDFENALKMFDQSKAIWPDNPRLPAAYAEVYLSQGKLKEALEKFQEAAKLDPKRATNWSRIGYIQAQQGDREQARGSIRKALALHPADFNALEQLGEIELRDDNFTEAVKHLVAAAEAAPDHNKARLYLRAADALLKKDRRAEAALTLKAAVTRAPNLPGEVFARLGELLVLEGDLNAAVNAYTVAAERLPRDPVPYEILGELYAAMDKPGDAEGAWRESLRIQNRSVVHVQMARLKLKRKEEAAAEAALEAALQAATGDEKREAIELSDLLITMKRKPDALKLLSLVAAEEDNSRDIALQLRTAKLARELKDAAIQQSACARALDAGVAKCP